MVCMHAAAGLDGGRKSRACCLFTTAPAKRAAFSTATCLPPQPSYFAASPAPSFRTARMQRVQVASAPYASEEDEDVDEEAISGDIDAEFDAIVAEEDLWQFEDRHRWYLPKYAADDAPDWNPATFVHSHPVCTGVREIVLDMEISRELVPIRNAYLRTGQRVQVRINGGELLELPVCCAPFPKMLNREPLYLCRHDLSAGDTKRVTGPVSVRAPVSLYVEEAAGAEAYGLSADDLVEVGPFVGIFQYPTIIMFVSGAGIATARALIEVGEGAGGLCFTRRQAVVLYYSVPNASSVAFGEHVERWQEEYGVRVETSTRDTFQEMFDYDDALVYEPSQTAALVLTGGDEEAEAAAIEACREAEIEMVVLQSADAPLTRCIEENGEREI